LPKSTGKKVLIAHPSTLHFSLLCCFCRFKMSKRSAEADEQTALKAGERPIAEVPMDEAGEFEDEFEDEFESEDEILEAGVDGRPDAEREEEEKGSHCPYVL
jgi:hypothetical protein